MVGQGYYKFLNAEHVPLLLERPASLLFGRLSYYRLLEAATQNDRIGDMREGRSEVVFQPVVLGNGDNLDAEKALADAGLIKLENCTNITASAVLIRHIDCFVLSMAYGEYDKCEAVFARCGDEAYDAALQVVDMDRLLATILNATVDGRRVEELFQISAGPVVYEDREAHVMGGDWQIPPADPFLKQAKYEGQMEYRVVLTPREAYPQCDRIFLSLDSDQPLFVPVTVAGSTRVRFDGVKPDICVAVNNIKESILTWVGIEEKIRRRFTPDPSMTGEQWSELSNMRTREEWSAFSPVFKCLCEAFWSIREQHPWPDLDSLILTDRVPASVYMSRFQQFLRHYGWLGEHEYLR